MDIIATLSKELNIETQRLIDTIALMDEGNTIPFIARYRKEATGSMDEVAIGNIKDMHEKLKAIVQRKDTIIATIEEQGKLTPELKNRIYNCFDAVELEDIYLPYKPKRRTRATMAKERGLEPLADVIWHQQYNDVKGRERAFICADVPTVDDAIAGACDIIAERVSEDEKARNTVRRLFARDGVLSSKVVKGKEGDGIKYSDYYEWQEKISRISSHRLLAIMRGEDEGFLRMSITIDGEEATDRLCRLFVKRFSPSREYMEAAVADFYREISGTRPTPATDDNIPIYIPEA